MHHQAPCSRDEFDAYVTKHADEHTQSFVRSLLGLSKRLKAQEGAVWLKHLDGTVPAIQSEYGDRVFLTVQANGYVFVWLHLLATALDGAFSGVQPAVADLRCDLATYKPSQATTRREFWAHDFPDPEQLARRLEDFFKVIGYPGLD